MIGFALWYLWGFVAFWAARYALSMGIDDCQPVRVKTLIGCAFMSLIPPATTLAAVVWFLMWIGESRKLWRWLNVIVVNPCDWFSRGGER